MAGPHPAVAALRHALRASLDTLDRLDEPTDRRVLLAVSGGTDSLALAATAAFLAAADPRKRTGPAPRFGAVIIDHNLQPGSGDAAARAARACEDLGLDPVLVRQVQVQERGDGVEAAARGARYEAIEHAATEAGADVVVTGHTRDDQSEQVLLGLARGSGTRSLAGMPAVRPISPGSPVRLVRPFLQVTREQTAAACAALGLQPWDDPHNADHRFTRVRARAAVSDLEVALGPGLAAALARTADQVRADADALDQIAAEARAGLGPMPWAVADLVGLPDAVRLRLWKLAAGEYGSPAGSVTASHLYAADAVISRWSGQGPIDLPGSVRLYRGQGEVWLAVEPKG